MNLAAFGEISTCVLATSIKVQEMRGTPDLIDARLCEKHLSFRHLTGHSFAAFVAALTLKIVYFSNM